MLGARRQNKMDKLLLEIKQKQKKMIEFGLEFGFNSQKTIETSQQLDVLIIAYQKYSEKVSYMKRFTMFFSKVSLQAIFISLIK